MFDILDFLKNNLIIIFLSIMFLLFSISFYFFTKGLHNRFVKHVPSLLTSFGILGTFLGITLGLMDFNVKDIDDSIILLLDDLKFAFITSLIGIFLSILFKLFTSLERFQVKKEEEKVVQLKDLLEELKRQNNKNEQNEFFRENLNFQEKINTNLVKNQMLYEDYTKILTTKLDQFSERLSKNATEQIVKALNLVVIDFNKNLKEEFGENFKRLDSSIIELITWQRENKEKVIAMYLTLDKFIKSVDGMNTSYENINNNSQKLQFIMEDLKSTIELNQKQINYLDNNLKNFTKINESALNLFPSLDSNINNTIKNIEKLAKVQDDKTKNVTQKFDFYIEEFVKSLNKTTTENYVKLCESIENQHLNFQESSEQYVDEMAEAMAEALTTISKQFTDDYQKLVNEMKLITNAHKNES